MAHFTGALLVGPARLAPFGKLSIGGFMTATNSLVPSPEQVDLWFDDAVRLNSTPKYYIARQAAQWGSDQELEACCKWLPKLPPWSADDLRRHRRPQPPSLKERALEQLGCIQTDRSKFGMGISTDTIRRALEALDD